MKIILAVNAIKPPLTGIGRYVWELANRIPVLPGVDSVRFFADGRWVNDVGTLLDQSPAKLAVRQRLLRSPVAVAAYRLLSPILLRHRLRPFSDHLYHGPNFYLPPFSGPTISTIHDLSIFRCPQFHPPERVDFMRREISLTLERANFLITDSEFIRQEIIEFFSWPEDKVGAVHLGVAEEYRPRGADETMGVLGKFGLEFGAYALCVATIEPRKNIDALLSAYEALPQALRNHYPLVLAGGKGWRSETIHRRIEQGQRQGWLHYLGYVSETELPILFSGARGFVYPSLYEGFGLPVLEAMASGLPVLISNRASLPEVASGAALITEAEDIHAMTENIRVLLEDDQWRSAATGRSLEAAARFSWEAMARKTVDVYRAVNRDAFGGG
ncbi:MAG: glycosyltransferase family 1 protein [Gallionella sp.]|nr:glycosyltransferase family 1 protein [Gallionella sp.]